MRGKFHKGATFAGTVWSSQYRALFYGSESVKQLSYILLGLLLAKHANEKLSISEAFVSSLFETSVQLALAVDVDGTANPLKNSRNHFRFVFFCSRTRYVESLFLFS